MSTQPPRVLVLGFGNTLRSDDGIGYRLAERVASLGLPGVTCRSLHQLTPEIAAEIANSDLVLFIDARLEPGHGLPVGPDSDQGRVQIEQVQPHAQARVTSHIATPSELMALTDWLYEARPQATIVSILIENIGLGENLSPGVELAIPAALEAIQALIRTGGQIQP